METFYENILSLVLFILPAYISNAAPVLLGGGAPIDFGKKHDDGERVLGDGKTIRGFIGGIASGIVFAGLLALFVQLKFFENPRMQFFGGVTLSIGAMIGDSLGSYIKRRFKVGSGKQFILDSTMFLFVALILASPFVIIERFDFVSLLILLFATLVLHPLTNFIANKLGLKKVPW
ncbi:MAG: CDP-2,3-bis-(O-geranylgeranyl)-sn-glycerol synthase [Candidatus Micrarchaeota archaeon]